MRRIQRYVFYLILIKNQNNFDTEKKQVKLLVKQVDGNDIVHKKTVGLKSTKIQFCQPKYAAEM